MKVSEIMSRNVQVARPDESIGDVSRRMAEHDLGFMPVADDGTLVGTVTDRDIVVRAIAEGRHDALVADVMSRDIASCLEDDDLDDIVQIMGNIQVRRMPVVDNNERLIGVITLADAVLDHDPEGVGIAMTGVVEPGGSHAQGGDGKGH
jgi:CBS domain-containing protein